VASAGACCGRIQVQYRLNYYLTKEVTIRKGKTKTQKTKKNEKKKKEKPRNDRNQGHLPRMAIITVGFDFAI
jgi:hypothetical protein